MLKDGKEYFDDFSDYSLTAVQAYNVQSKINQVQEIPNDEKSDATVRNGSIESTQSNHSGNGSSFTLGMFETIGSVNSARKSNRTREQLYSIYSKMGTLGIVKRAIDVISDEASQKNDDNDVMVVSSSNEKIYNCLRSLFFDKLSINTELWSIFSETAKFGDNFYEITLDVNKDNIAKGIRRLKYIDPCKIEAHEKDGRIDYYTYKVQSNKNSYQLEQRLFPWQIAHFKIEDKETKPYGKSLLYSGIRSYERLTATEDIFLTYTISRTPNRRVFKIDVGGLPQLEAQRAIREMRDSYRSQQVIDNDGNLNQISSILSITSDIFIPVREGQSGTTIETLQGDTMNMNQNMNFLENFKKDLIASFNIPSEYLGLMDNSQADKSTTLSQKDIKFARFIERVQQQIIKTLYKIATLELVFNGFKGDDLKNFTLELTPPSTTKEITETSLLETKIQLLQSMQQLNMFPEQWLLKRVLRLSDKEISEIKFLKMIEAKDAQANMAQQQGAGGLGIPGGELPPDLSGQEAGNPEELQAGGETPPEGETPQSGEEQPETTTPETLNQDMSSYLNVDGQKYLIEDKQDFLVLMKYINEQKKYKSNPTSEFMKDIDNIGKKQIINSYNPYNFLKESGEFGGMELQGGSLMIFEGENKKVGALLCE